MYQTRLLSCVFFAFSVLIAPANTIAGQIEIGGAWRTFDDLLLFGGPVQVSEMPSGLTGHRGREDPLLDEEARILVIMGQGWTSEFRARRLEERFWPLDDLTIVLEERMRFLPVSRHTLVPPFEREDAWYQFDIVLYGHRYGNGGDVFAMFQHLTNIAKADDEDFHFMHCIEMLGKISWSSIGGYDGDPESKKRLFTYTLYVESVRLAGLIPQGFYSNAPRVPELEAATDFCGDAVGG